MDMAISGCSSRKRKSESDLEDLPADLFGPVADKLPAIQDLVRFGAVCRWWRQLGTRKERRVNHDHTHAHPWLMLSEDKTMKRSFYSPTRDEVFKIDYSGCHVRGTRCWGSPFGWVVVMPANMKLSLFNPLSRASVRVSCLQRILRLQYVSEPIKDPGPRRGPNDENYWCFINVAKLILTAPHQSPNCYMFAISFNSRRLGFLDIGARPSLWSTVEGVDQWTDVVCFQGTTYFGCLKDGRVLTLDTSSQSPKAVAFAPPPPTHELGDDSDGMNYLVELRGELCMVVRCGGLSDRLKLEFRVFRMDMSTRQWTRIMSLGGHCFFFGTNYSYAVQASDQLKPDCIYYTNDHGYDYYNTNYHYSRVKVCGTGIYDLFKGEATALTTPPSVASCMTSPYCPPLWFTPSLS